MFTGFRGERQEAAVNQRQSAEGAAVPQTTSGDAAKQAWL